MTDPVTPADWPCHSRVTRALYPSLARRFPQGLADTQLRAVLGDDDGRIDNRPCLELVASPPNGILQLLDFQCKAPSATDGSFCVAVNGQHGASQFLRVPRLSRDCSHDETTGFVVRHFAGDVTYSAGSFLELNNDSMCAALAPQVPRRTGSINARSMARPDLATLTCSRPPHAGTDPTRTG